MSIDEQKISGGLKPILESLLFVSGRPLKAKELSKILSTDEAAIHAALSEIAEDKINSGIVLLENKGEYQLSTNSKYSTEVKNFLNAELREKLTDATVEVLAIITYRQPISKAEIEAIRGVNSQYSLRNLLIRGLIEKIANPADARSFLYQTTTELLMHLGLSSVKDLPEFDKLVEKIKLPETPALSQQATAEPTHYSAAIAMEQTQINNITIEESQAQDEASKDEDDEEDEEA